MLKSFISFACVLCCLKAYAQADTTTPRIYKVNHKWEIAVPAVLLGSMSFGFTELDKVASFTEADVNALNPADINSFDRPVAFYNPAHFKQNGKISDLCLNVAVASPVLLMLDKRIRKDWADFVSIFLVAHAVDNAFYFTGAFSVRRARPLTYNPGLSMEDKIGIGKSNSFFSGHVSWSATSSFLMAKMYTDYHHIKGKKRILIFTAAAVPPGLVGYFRMKAGKHFKTDVITGLVFGAACGIGIPELHRIRTRENNLSLRPFNMQGARGLTLNYVIR